MIGFATPDAIASGVAIHPIKSHHRSGPASSSPALAQSADMADADETRKSAEPTVRGARSSGPVD